jgi:hypothetical protein
MKYMFRNPVDITKTSSGSDKSAASENTRISVPRVAGKFKRNITANLRRTLSNPNLSPSDLSPANQMSQTEIMRGLGQAGSGFNPDGSDSDSESLFGPNDAPLLDPLMQRRGSPRSLSNVFTISPGSSPAYNAAVSPLIQMPKLTISPASSVLSVSASTFKPKKEELEEIKDNITDNLKEVLPNELSEVSDDGAPRRAVSHIVEETIEVVALTPKKLHSMGSEEAKLENKSRKPNVFLHYKHPLYDTMMTAVQLSGQYDYDPARMFHKREPTLPSKKKAKQLPKSINGTKPPRDLVENLQQLLDGAKVIAPICIGFDGALTGHELEEVLKFYASNKAAEITFYIGEYNRLEDPEDRLAEIGKAKREAWQQHNKTILDSYKNGYDLKLMTSLPDDLTKIHNPIIIRNGSVGSYTYQLIVDPATNKNAIDVTDEKLVAELDSESNAKSFSMPNSTNYITSDSPLGQCITSAGGHPRAQVVSILLREDLVKTDAYKHAKDFVTEKFRNKELKYGSVRGDAYEYMTGKQKPSTPQLSSMNGDGAEVVSQLMLSSDDADADDQDIKQFRAVAEATVEAAIKDSADKVKAGARFLFEFRAIQEANNRSMFKQNTLFASSGAKSKQQKKADQVVHPQSQPVKGSARMTPGGLQSE